MEKKVEKPPEANQLPPGQAVDLSTMIDYAPDSVISRTLLKNSAGTLTLFSFDAGQGLSEHTAPYNAVVMLLDGRAELTIGGRAVEAVAGRTVLMPAHVPHAVHAPERFKMLLVMIKGE